VAQPFSVDPVPPPVCYRPCRPYRVATSNTKNASSWTSAPFFRARVQILIPQFGKPGLSSMALPICNTEVRDVEVEPTNLGLVIIVRNGRAR
jgi:hypothetical protein